MYNKLIITLLSIITLGFVSCSDDEITEVTPDAFSNPTIRVQDGYLAFQNQITFDSIVEKLRDAAHTVTIPTRGAQNNPYDLLPSHFISIAKTKENAHKATRVISEEESEEITLDEYNAMKAENILVDPLLTHLMDTTLRIQIADTLYKITPHGVFFTNTSNASSLESIIETFDTTQIAHYTYGESYMLRSGVTFMPSRDKSYSTTADIEPIQKSVETRMIHSDTDLNLHVGYNTEDYRWKNHSLWQKGLDFLRGRQVNRERYFDKKHRIQVEVFDVNYQFYHSAGIQVKMQKRKRFIVNYWVSDKCEDLVIGFNLVSGTLTMDNPTNYSAIMPSMSSQWHTFKSYFENQEKEFIYQRIYHAPIVKDWINTTVDKLYLFLPHIHLKTGSGRTILHFPTHKTLQQMYDAPFKAMWSIIHSINGKWINSIEKEIKPTDPRLAYLIWGRNEFTFEKSKPFITGVKHYGHSSSRTVRFSQSFGFHFDGGAVTPFLPSKFTIQYFDGFGAVKYKGRWLGVRFIGKK